MNKEYIVSEEDFELILLYSPAWVKRHSDELVRCKDCKHWHTDYCPMAYREYEHSRGNEPQDYCSLAERKDKCD